MTDEEILERGTKAATLLNNHDLMTFIEDERKLLLEGIGNSQPHEVKTREANYAQYHAIGSFIDGLHQYVTKAKALVEAYEQQNLENTEDTD